MKKIVALPAVLLLLVFSMGSGIADTHGQQETPDIFGQVVTGETVIEVVDTTPPTITVQFIPIEVEADEGTFRIEFSATDDYDPNPIVSAVLLVPSMVDLAVEFHVQDEVKLEFDLEDNKVEIKGPNPEEEWSEIQRMGGIAVLNEQIIKVEVKEGLKYEYKYEDGGLKIEAPEIILRVTAIDASGNEATSTTSPTFAE